MLSEVKFGVATTEGQTWGKVSKVGMNFSNWRSEGRIFH